MTRFGRRTFLGSSAGVAASVAAAGALPAAQPPAGGEDAEVSLARGAGPAGPSGLLRSGALTVNGAVAPVGVDPDDCSFAWKLQATGRAVAQTAYRIVVRRTDPAHAGITWDSGPVQSARQAFVAYGGPPLAADAAYEWTVRRAATATTGAPRRLRPTSRRRCGRTTGRRCGCARPGPPCSPTA